MVQDILVYIAVFLAIAYLVWRFYPRKKNKDKDCGPDCKC
jgi:hypothetical protein